MAILDYLVAELEFVLADSASARRFTRIDPLRQEGHPKRSALQRSHRSSCGRISCSTWERINRGPAGDGQSSQELPDRCLPRFSRRAIRKVRIDSTVTETHILEPSSFSRLRQLLYDAVRVLSRLLARGRCA